MGTGQVWKDPVHRYEDGRSGRTVVRLTDYLGHSNHLYFTDPCWLDGGRAFIFTSDRENQSNLFRYELADGTITQLTDLHGRGRPGGAFCAATGRHYFWWHGELCELDVGTFELRAIFRAPEGMAPSGQYSPTADGRYVCTALGERPARSGPARISYAYSSFRETFRARPLSRVVRVDVRSGEAEVLHEERAWIGHVNTSPTRPDVLTFCHEGPWDEVDQRIWGLHVHTGALWKIRSQEDAPARAGMAIGHEYWFADGERIGYHGHPRAGGGPQIFGFRRWDDTGGAEAAFPFRSTHFHSLDETLVVGDGNSAFAASARPFIQLFRREGAGPDGEARYTGPRILSFHRSTFNDQHAHPHPRFTRDGRHVLYTSDLTGYSNLYLVEVGDFEDLPELP